MVSIKLKRNNLKFYENNLTSDSNGIVQFILDCTKQECDLAQKLTKSLSSISIEVTPAIDSDESLQLRTKHFSIYPWYSTKNTYIQLIKEKNVKEFKCDEEIKIKIRIVSPQNLSNQNLYFQLQSRSDVVTAGHYRFNANETFSTKNGYSIELIENKKLLLANSFNQNGINF